MQIQKLKQVYFGNVASTYDANRIGPKWMAEQEAVCRFLNHVHGVQGTYSVLDVPVGTGRFLDFYKGHSAVAEGIDISEDMLSEARRKAEGLQMSMVLSIGNILDLREKFRGVDLVVCIRLANWLDAHCLLAALEQLCQVARRFVILGIRIYPEASNYKPWRLLVQWLRERVRRLKRNKITIHREKTVMQWLTSHGLVVLDQQLIERGAEGSLYSIYLLEKATPA